MNPRTVLFIGLGFILISSSCERTAPPKESLATASGILVHHPPSVRTAEAWKGHHFLVGGVPVQASEQVTEAELLKYVGKEITVTGRWNPGVVWKPARDDSQSEAPVNPDRDKPMVRGDGIVVETLQELKQR